MLFCFEIFIYYFFFPSFDHFLMLGCWQGPARHQHLPCSGLMLLALPLLPPALDPAALLRVGAIQRTAGRRSLAEGADFPACVGKDVGSRNNAGEAQGTRVNA